MFLHVTNERLDWRTIIRHSQSYHSHYLVIITGIVALLSCVLAQETHYCGPAGRTEVGFAFESLGSEVLKFRIWGLGLG